jgi:ubiquinone/menaquinone biosynthesis C-methylase UbiE
MTTVEQSMADYYRQRAAIYERVYHRLERQDDLRAMEAWIAEQFVGRRVLELACGTGWWTPHGAKQATDWLATDANEEVLAIARTKTLPACVRFATADAYELRALPEQAFDAALAGFWWSHVPLPRLSAWLEQLHERLQPGARVVMLDNRFVPGSSTPISRTDAQGNTYQLRELDDGSVHEVVKNFPSADQALAALGARACRPQWHTWAHYWALSYELN